MELALETMGKPIGVAELHPEAGQRPLVKIKVNSDKRTCFVSLFRNKTIEQGDNYRENLGSSTGRCERGSAQHIVL